MSTKLTTPNAAIIAANLVALHARLRHALAEVTDASAAMADGQQNLAIGCIGDLGRVLPECEALFRTIMMLHRTPDHFSTDKEVRS
jgi:hypothetical protein